MKPLILFTIVLLQGCTLTAGIGGAFAPNVPREYITGHEQFHLSIEHTVVISESVSVETAWHHYSNGAHLGIGRHENRGMDFLGTQVKVKLWNSERKQ